MCLHSAELKQTMYRKDRKDQRDYVQDEVAEMDERRMVRVLQRVLQLDPCVKRCPRVPKFARVGGVCKLKPDLVSVRDRRHFPPRHSELARWWIGFPCNVEIHDRRTRIFIQYCLRGIVLVRLSFSL